MVAKQREIADAQRLGLQNSERGAGHGGFKAKAKKHHFFSGIFLRDVQRVQR